MAFYPDQKQHISPSALAAWYTAPGTFVKSYFAGEKSKESAAMKGGKKIHALIEAGLLVVKHRFEHPEAELVSYAEIGDDKFKVLGFPDSYELQKIKGTTHDRAVFVDYKSGKENTWDALKLAGDLKMKLTAWLVWMATNKPTQVVGYIEYIPTQWNSETREIEPTEGESTVAAELIYTTEEMEAFTAVIIKTCKDINEAYKEWLESSDEFVNQDDLAEFGDLTRQAADIGQRLEQLKERIGDQMTMGKKGTLSTPVGTFYYTNRKSYDYPPTLKIHYLDYGLVLEDADAITAAAGAAKKKYETETDPARVTTSLSFRAKK